MSQPGRTGTMFALFNALWMSISGRLTVLPFAVMPVFGAGVLPVIVISPFGRPTPGPVHERVVRPTPMTLEGPAEEPAPATEWNSRPSGV